jgi:hypothetical protein
MEGGRRGVGGTTDMSYMNKRVYHFLHTKQTTVYDTNLYKK